MKVTKEFYTEEILMVTINPTTVICLNTCNKDSLYLPSFEEFEAEADKLPLRDLEYKK